MIQHYRRLPAFTASALLLLAILYLTLWPSPLPDNTPSLFSGADKLVHAIMFGALCFALLVDLSILRRRPVAWSGAVLAAMACVALGGGIEILQASMNLGRSAEWADFIADTIGSGAALVLFRLLARKIS